MKFSTLKTVSGETIIDVDLKKEYRFLKTPDEDDVPEFEKQLPVPSLVKNGVRFTVPMLDPTPGFFFSFAEWCDDAEEAILVVDQDNNKVGAYFVHEQAKIWGSTVANYKGADQGTLGPED